MDDLWGRNLDRTQLRPAASDNVPMLSFQRLDVYRCSIEFLAFTLHQTEAPPRGHAALMDQFRKDMNARRQQRGLAPMGR